MAKTATIKATKFPNNNNFINIYLLDSYENQKYQVKILINQVKIYQNI